MRAPVRDFWTDVADPVTIAAEEWVYRYLCEKNKTVEDARPRNLPWDFIVHRSRGRSITVDAKADSHAANTGRLLFEDREVFSNGVERAGWGHAEGLDMVAVCAIGAGRCLFVSVPLMRAYVAQLCEEGKLGKERMPHGWAKSKRPNRPRYEGSLPSVMYGWAIPLGELLICGALVSVTATGNSL